MKKMDIVEKVARAIAKSEGWELPNDMTLPYSAGSRIGKVMAVAKIAVDAVVTATPMATKREY